MKWKFDIKSLFKADYERYEGVSRFKIGLMRLVFLLTFLLVGFTSWSVLLTNEGPWENLDAMAFCVWAAYSTLSLIGVFQPLKMLPLLLFQIFYKVIWLIVVAYPLIVASKLVGSGSAELTYTFAWVVLPIIAVPWKYTFRNYIAFKATG